MSGIATLLGSPLQAATAPGVSPAMDAAWTPGTDASALARPPWRTETPGWSRTGADEAAQVDAQLSEARRARDAADVALGRAVADARTAVQRTRGRLRGILAELEAGVRGLQPSLDTPAGRLQMVDLLHQTTQDVRTVVEEAQVASRQAARAIGSAQQSYVLT